MWIQIIRHPYVYIEDSWIISTKRNVYSIIKCISIHIDIWKDKYTIKLPKKLWNDKFKNPIYL